MTTLSDMRKAANSCILGEKVEGRVSYFIEEGGIIFDCYRFAFENCISDDKAKGLSKSMLNYALNHAVVQEFEKRGFYCMRLDKDGIEVYRVMDKRFLVKHVSSLV